MLGILPLESREARIYTLLPSLISRVQFSLHPYEDDVAVPKRK